MSDEATYTLAEAQAELRKRECATHGHSWSTISTFDGPIRIVCDTCNWGGSVTMGEKP